MERLRKTPLLVVTVERRTPEEGDPELYLVVDETTQVLSDGWQSKRVVDERIDTDA